MGGGLGAEEVWQCIGVGGQRSHRTVEEEQQLLPRDRWWCAESVGEPLADRETSRGHKCLLERNRPVR